MKTTGTKKPCPTTNLNKVICANTGRLTMSNITQFSNDKQIQVSEHQLRRLLEFVNITEQKLLEVQTLIRVIAEKSEAHSTAKTLAHIASGITMDYREECGEELEFFKTNSPQLVSTFVEELVA